jgi:hypothetical protein
LQKKSVTENKKSNVLFMARRFYLKVLNIENQDESFGGRKYKSGGLSGLWA